MVREYTVKWEVIVKADSNRDAARQAMAMQRDAIANPVFFVTDNTCGSEVFVDLFWPEQYDVEL